LLSVADIIGAIAAVVALVSSLVKFLRSGPVDLKTQSPSASVVIKMPDGASFNVKMPAKDAERLVGHI
jgi:hypothetical protein